jgi:CheY-specific phosphatase CheX
MSHASHKPDLARIGECAFTEVLATFLSLPAVPRTISVQERIPDASDQVAATVSLSGDGLSATVRILLPLAFVAQAVNHLAGLQGPEGEAIHEDTAGEIANMVAGRVAAQLAAEGFPAALGTPSVSRSASLPIEPRPGNDHGRAALVCEGHHLSVEIHCRYAAP